MLLHKSLIEEDVSLFEKKPFFEERSEDEDPTGVRRTDMAEGNEPYTVIIVS